MQEEVSVGTTTTVTKYTVCFNLAKIAFSGIASELALPRTWHRKQIMLTLNRLAHSRGLLNYHLHSYNDKKWRRGHTDYYSRTFKRVAFYPLGFS